MTNYEALKLLYLKLRRIPLIGGIVGVIAPLGRRLAGGSPVAALQQRQDMMAHMMDGMLLAIRDLQKRAGVSSSDVPTAPVVVKPDGTPATQEELQNLLAAQGWRFDTRKQA